MSEILSWQPDCECFAYDIAWKYLPYDEVDDFVSEAYFVYTKCVEKYKPELGFMFSTYFYNACRYRVFNYIRDKAAKRKLPEVTFEEKIHDKAAEEPLFSTETISEVVDALKRLKVKHREVIQARLFDHLTFEEIAAKQGKTYQAVQQLYKRAMAALREDLYAREVL